MKNLEQILKKVINEEITKGKFIGNITLVEYHNKICFEGEIEYESGNILIRYNPKYEKENPGGMIITVRDITRHEINHIGYAGFCGCPRNEENHMLITKPIKKVLNEHYEGDLWYLVTLSKIVNSFEDIVVNVDLSRKFVLEGIVNLMEDVGRHIGFSAFHEAYVKLNMYLWGKEKQKRRLERYFKHTEEVSKVLENFLNKTGIRNLNKQTMRKFFNDEKNWPGLARIYAEEFVRLLI